jgi:hypothetical protein
MLAAFAFLPVSAPPAHPQNICRDHSLKSAVIHSTVTLQTARQDQVQITSSTIVEVPTSWPGAARMLRDDGSQWSALDCFLPIHDFAFRPRRPKIWERKSQVIVRDLVSQTAFPQNAYYLGPEVWSVGIWEVSKDGSHLNVSFQGKNLSVPVKWTLELKTNDLNIMTSTPSPSSENGEGDYTWTLISKKANSNAAVMLPERLAIDWAGWRWPIGEFTNLLLILSYGLAFYLIIYWLTGRFARRIHSRARLAETARVARRIALFACLWFLLQAGDNYLHRMIGADILSQHDVALTEAGTSALVSAWFYLAACNSGGFKTRQFFRFTVLASAFAAPFFLLPNAELPDGTPGGLALNLVPQVIAEFYFYSGVAIWAFRLSPVFTRARSPAGWRPPRAQRYIAYFSAATFTALSVADLIITSSRDWGHYFLANPEESRFLWVAMSSAYAGQSAWLGGEVQGALWLLVTLAFLAVLRMAALDSPDVFFPGDGSLELTSLAVMLGFFFVGAWGQVADFPVPIALLLVIIGFRYIAVSKSGTPSLARRIKIENARPSSGPLLTSNKEAFFDAAERIADLNGQLAAIGTGSLTAEEASAKRARIRGEIEQLRQYIPVPAYRRKSLLRRSATPRLVLPHPYDPARALLDTGPGATWWDNGVQAIYLATPLIVLGTAYVMYKKVREGSINPLAFPYGLPGTLLGLASTAAGWVVVAFVFGAALPYIRGIRGTVKGVTVGLVHICALAVAAGMFDVLGEALYKNVLSDSLIFLFFLATLGVIIDARTLYYYGGSSGLFSRLYRLGSTRAVVTYMAAIIAATIGIWQQANVHDQAFQQRAQVGQQVVQNINQIYGSGSAPP